jgi:hypothetical protein
MDDPLSYLSGVGDPGHVDELLETFADYTATCARADTENAAAYLQISQTLENARAALRSLIGLELTANGVPA